MARDGRGERSTFHSSKFWAEKIALWTARNNPLADKPIAPVRRVNGCTCRAI